MTVQQPATPSPSTGSLPEEPARSPHGHDSECGCSAGRHRCQPASHTPPPTTSPRDAAGPRPRASQRLCSLLPASVASEGRAAGKPLLQDPAIKRTNFEVATRRPRPCSSRPRGIRMAPTSGHGTRRPTPHRRRRCRRQRRSRTRANRSRSSMGTSRRARRPPSYPNSPCRPMSSSPGHPAHRVRSADIREKFPQDFVFQNCRRTHPQPRMYGDLFGRLTFDQIRVVIANKLKERV